jgi:hypothetical protein
MFDPLKINRSENLIYPPLLEIVRKGLKKADETGIKAYIFEGFRFFERQTYLFCQVSPDKKPVTGAKAGYSWHNYGLAVDIVFDGSPEPGIQWDWAGDYVGQKKDDYDKLAKIMMDLKLEWLGLDFWDKPHFQLTRGLSIDQAFEINKKHGILGIWALMDTIV